MGREGTVFAKNSDRPRHEAQVVEWHPPRAARAVTSTQYLRIADAPAHGSRPT